MNKRREMLRRAVRGFVRSLPADLVSDMAALEKAGRLQGVLERALLEADLRELASRIVRAEITHTVTPALRGAAAALRVTNRAHETVTVTGSTDVFRASAGRFPLAIV